MVWVYDQQINSKQINVNIYSKSGLIYFLGEGPRQPLCKQNKNYFTWQ